MILVTPCHILGCWWPRVWLQQKKRLICFSAVCVSLSRGTRRDNVNDDLWQRQLRGEGGWGEGVLFSEVSIVWSCHSALSSCLLFINVYCPVRTVWKHTLLKREANTSDQVCCCCCCCWEAAWAWNCVQRWTTEEKTSNWNKKKKKLHIFLKSKCEYPSFIQIN